MTDPNRMTVESQARSGNHHEDAGDTLVRLPMFVGLTDGDQERVIDSVLAWS
jgi:dTDP-4-amino-4,6-dideoxygalactose transaminase